MLMVWTSLLQPCTTMLTLLSLYALFVMEVLTTLYYHVQPMHDDIVACTFVTKVMTTLYNHVNLLIVVGTL